MMLIEKVRTATSALHHALDAAMMPYIQAVQSKEDYAALLLLFYGFCKPVYDDIEVCIDRNQLPDFDSRRKPSWILDDLHYLEVDYAISICPQLPYVANNATAFGALYVLEGSTLGGMVIRKMISDQLGLQQGVSFLAVMVSKRGSGGMCLSNRSTG